MRSDRPHEFVRAWDPHVPGVREVFHARFVEHAYPPHTHDAWTVLIVDDGAVRYALDRHEHGSGGTAVSILPPHVAHDGRAATTHGFAKRVLYLDPGMVGSHLIGRAVDRPTIGDPALVRSIRLFHDTLARPRDALEAETRVAFVAERLTAHLAGAPHELPTLAQVRARSHDGAERRAADVAEMLRSQLDADPFAPQPLGALAGQVGVSPTHLVRCFTAVFGVPPHAYLGGRRVDAARRMLLDGLAPADVAATVGFHDQAHLTRHFRRHVGTTPGRFRRRR